MIAMKDLKGSVPKMNCVATGVVTGRQTAARAELSSVLFATELSCLKHPQHKVEIFTDAKYVCNVVDAIKCSDTHTLHYKMANQDLVSRLADIWNPNLHQVIKVKAHRSFDDAVDEEDLWHVLGNNCADMAANAANQLIPSAFAQALSDSATFARKEFSNLRCVLIFILELNLHQMYILAEGHKTMIQQSHSHNGKNGDYHDLLAGNDHREQTEMTSYEQALEHLITWTPQHSKIFLVHQHEISILQAVSLGGSIATLVWRWLQLLEWPSCDGSDNSDLGDWGITYFELVVNFLTCTGHALPIAINPGERYVQYCQYWSDDALLLPPRTRAAHIQVYSLEKLFRQLFTLSGYHVVPSFEKKQWWPCKSLHRLGFRAPASGIPRRPKLPLVNETMTMVHKYLEKCKDLGSLSLPLDKPTNNPILQFEMQDELSPKSRFRRAAKVRKQSKARRQED